MLALRVTYLMGRVYSAVFEDGDAKADPEWPPHPSRLFSALVAAWGEGGGEEELRPALEWLEQQPAPKVIFGAHTTRRLTQAFVPVNDAETLPEDRPRKGRVFPSASLAHPDIYFVWEGSPTAEVRTKLDRILQRTSSMGHSASLVSVEIAEGAGNGPLTEWLPGAILGERMRIPYPGRLNDLIERHRRFEQSGSKVHRPTAGRTTLYAPQHDRAATPTGGAFDQMIILRRTSGPRTSLRSALSLTSALRGAILSHAPQPAPECISGHGPGSTPEAPARSEAPHLAIIPLANVGFPHATGEVLGAAAALPRAFTGEQRRMCWRVLKRVEELTMPWGRWTVSLADAEEERRTLLPETWTDAGMLWASVTPFVFDRYPKDPYGAEAEAIVRDAFARVGLPAPCEIDLHYNAWHIGVPRASAFAAAPGRPGKPQRYHCHIRARFEQPIAGPVLAGAGRYYGYGLFRRLREDGGNQ